jgi:hypothetical protein
MTTTTGRSLLVGALMLLGLATAAPATSGSDPWAKLHRALHLPSQLPHGRCPVTSAQLVAPGISAAQGAGPVYPVDAYPTLQILAERAGWRGRAVQWIARPEFSGKVLIRGRRVNGNDQVAFGSSAAAAAELHVIVPRHARTWWTGSTNTLVRGPGCFAWQIDGPHFSRVVVFRAVG